MNLMNEEDEAKLKLVQEFNLYDLYTKHDIEVYNPFDPTTQACQQGSQGMLFNRLTWCRSNHSTKTSSLNSFQKRSGGEPTSRSRTR